MLLHNNKNVTITKLFYIYIYAFSRCFYPKLLTVHSDYTFFCQYVCSLGIEPTIFALLTVRSPARRPPSLRRGRLLLDSSLPSTHLCTHSSLHSTHLCTYSSLSAVPNVWTIYAPQPRPSACRDYFYQHSHVHGSYHCVCNLTDYIRFRALGTQALRCRLGCPVLDYCFVFACWLLI